jgi:hypothetical protein
MRKETGSVRASEDVPLVISSLSVMMGGKTWLS